MVAPEVVVSPAVLATSEGEAAGVVTAPLAQPQTRAAAHSKTAGALRLVTARV